MNDEIRELALKNALSHGGKAEQKAVISKLLGGNASLRSRAKEIIPSVISIVKEVNALTPEKQREEVERIDPAFFNTEKKVKRTGLPELPGAEPGKVITRLPPEPNGYPHIGHGLSFFFNYYYAEKYHGKAILRFDDTNPKAEKLEYYKAIEEDLRWLKLDWERIHHMSDDMDLYYRYARELIAGGNAYVCDCPQEKVSKLRFEGKTCGCASNTPERNMELWEQLFDAPEGKMVLRLKGKTDSKNTAMRDPTICRVIDCPHPLHADKYRVWPVYDFACAIEDSVLGITHVLRSNEFALRIELQDYIRGLLGLRDPVTLQYSRFSIRGSPTAKRLIRPLIEDGTASGWDDPRLVTLRGLRRRGIVPETVHELAKEMGLSTAEPVIDWSLVESINRKIIDPTTKRFFFVKDPVDVMIDGLGSLDVELRMHPTADMGTRAVHVDGAVKIASSDASDLSEGDILRLKDLCNIRIISIGRGGISAAVHEEEVDLRDLRKVQWVGTSPVPVDVLVAQPIIVDDEINRDSLHVESGVAEQPLLDAELGEIVQFERYGFVRIDTKENGCISVVYSHR